MISTTKDPEVIEFDTQIGEDGVIRVPEGLAIPQGPVEVVLTFRKPTTTTPSINGSAFAYMIEIAEEARRLNPDLPPDMAENHDHYAHGAPKR